MSPDRIAEFLGWNAEVFKSDARRDYDGLPARVLRLVDQAVSEEREACALAVIQHPGIDRYSMAMFIRKRGEK